MVNRTLKKSVCVILAAVIALGALAGCSNKKEKKVDIKSVKISDSDISKISVKVDDTLRENEFVGSAAIALNTQTIYEKSFGYADAVKKKKLDAYSIYHIGEMAQNITATAVLMLEKSGKLSLDDTIDKYFSVKYNDSISNVTIDQLLSNTVCFGSYVGEILDDPELYQKMFNLIRTDKNDRNCVEISNMIVEHILRHGYTDSKGSSASNYYLLGKIISKASGTSYREFVQKNIFDRLSMKHSTFINPKYKLAGYDMNNKVWKRFNEYPFSMDFGFLYSFAGIISCSNDMEAFYKALVNKQIDGIDCLKKIKLASSSRYCGFTRDGNNITASGRVAVHCSYVHINLETREAVSMLSNRVGKTDIKNTGDELYSIISSKINGIILDDINS